MRPAAVPMFAILFIIVSCSDDGASGVAARTERDPHAADTDTGPPVDRDTGADTDGGTGVETGADTDSETGTGDSSAEETGAWCYTFRAGVDQQGAYNQTVEELEVDMRTGAGRTTSVYTGARVDKSFRTANVTWNGGTFALGYDDGEGYSWMELDRSTSRAIDWGGTDVESAIAWSGTDYIVQRRSQFESQRYPDMASVVAGASTGTLTFSGATRFTVLGGELYGMWHSTDRMGVYDATTGAEVRRLVLGGYDTWTWGVAAFGDSVFSIDDGRQYAFERIGWFDRASGALIADVEVPGNDRSRPYSGLYCSATPM